MATFQGITPTPTAAPSGDYRAAVKATRTALPSHALEGVPVRRLVASVCAAEVEHSRNDFWRIAHRMGVAGLFDRYADPDCDAAFRLPHEAQAAAALVWLSHLQAHDADRRGPHASWGRMSRAAKAAWLRRRRYLVHGLIRVAGAYLAARAAIDLKAAA